ncbi:hypothetical protein P168DRAFT_283624 [Aspergillus campestris IBT 28561]|uniref:Uncharacterized protein n=1 Tax=Aspergillus campestris (strain IBT 28561) TaxID=1392248 RepID=A0A2I1CZ43_ASPC2|nr:uncharacterized protein P168DRAFT_283624 [Aspergillus campestris IBT 28561]PKY02888.1 hypothetical protein P168DRAFT_283624 [Aspergillus campestris IBT 28561]
MEKDEACPHRECKHYKESAPSSPPRAPLELADNIHTAYSKAEAPGTSDEDDSESSSGESSSDIEPCPHCMTQKILNADNCLLNNVNDFDLTSNEYQSIRGNAAAQAECWALNAAFYQTHSAEHVPTTNGLTESVSAPYETSYGGEWGKRSSSSYA